MRNVIIVLAVLLVLGGGVYWYANSATDATKSAQSEPETVATSTATLETGTYKVVEDESTVTWQAGKPAISGYVHTGRFSLASGGSFNVTDSSITGSTDIDINSLEIVSLGGGKAGQESALEGHLKSESFFDAATYPKGTFKVTDITPHKLPGPNQTDYTATGELTLKGKTETIAFPIKVSVTNPKEAVLKANFTIDRTRWGIDYGSASVTGKVTNQIIGDDVTLNLSVKLRK